MQVFANFQTKSRPLPEDVLISRLSGYIRLRGKRKLKLQVELRLFIS